MISFFSPSTSPDGNKPTFFIFPPSAYTHKKAGLNVRHREPQRSVAIRFRMAM
jgi:hypothetical protein